MVEDLRSFIKYIKTHHPDDFLEVNKLIKPILHEGKSDGPLKN